MNNRKNSDLKKRLADLRINEPLRLSKPARPPSGEIAQAEVPQLEAPPNRLTQKQPAQRENAEPEDARSQAAQKVQPHSEQALDERGAAHSERPALPHFKEPQIEPTHRELPHFGAPGNERVSERGTQSEVPRFEDAPIEQTQENNQGYFKLSHAIFSHAALREMSGDCFRLFLWLSSRAWRYPDSDGTVRASVGYMEVNVGMGHATISRALKALKEANLVSLEEVNFKRGNLWLVSPVALGSFDPDGNPPRSKVPQKEAPKIRQEAASKRGGSSLNASKKAPHIEQQIIKFNKTKNSEEGAEQPARFEVAVAEFERRLPEDERRALMQDFVSQRFPNGSLVSEKMLRNLVALEWYAQNRQQAPRLATVG